MLSRNLGNCYTSTVQGVRVTRRSATRAVRGSLARRIVCLFGHVPEHVCVLYISTPTPSPSSSFFLLSFHQAPFRHALNSPRAIRSRSRSTRIVPVSLVKH